MSTGEAKIDPAVATETVPDVKVDEKKATENGTDVSDPPNYTFKVKMTCGGCSGAVNNVLKKLEGVKHHNISLDTQLVEVWAQPGLDYETVLKTIKKTGKEVDTGKAGNVPMNVDLVGTEA